MRHFSFIPGLLVATLLVPLCAFAQETRTPPPPPGELRDAMQERIEEKRTEVRDAIEMRTQEMRAAVEEKREAVTTRIENARESFQERLAEKRQEFSSRIEAFRNERAKRLAENLYARLNAANDRLTDRYLSFIEHIQNSLERLLERVAVLQERGLDVGAIQALIATLEADANAFESQVLAQKEKVYTVAVTDETTAPEAFRAAHEQLKADLMLLQETVQKLRAQLREILGAVSDALSVEKSVE